MSLGLRERRAHRQRQLRWRLFKWTVALTAIVAAGLYSYETGSRLAEREVARLHEEIQTLTGRIEALEQDNVRLADAATGAERQAQEWQRRYHKDIPKGQDKALYDLVQQKIRDGVAPDRLSFVLAQARDAEVCEDGAETKRFYVATPLYQGANDAVGFGGNAFTVTAEGAASLDGAGNARAQYDPAQPIVVRFAQLGGKTSEATGVLPLHHAVIVGDREYRFSIVAGAPGMLNVTAGRCNYP